YIQYHTEKTFAKRVKTFTEKPELSLAKKFLESGDFVWNAGIFIWGVDAINKAFHEYLPEMSEVFDQVSAKFGTPDEKEAIRAAYSQCKHISIDDGIMEKAKNVFVCLGIFTWSELGSWASIHEISDKDSNNNVINANAQIYETRNCIIKGSPDKLIVVQGLSGYLVGEFGNVVIVCEKDKEEQFRRFVSDVKAKPNASEFI